MYLCPTDALQLKRISIAFLKTIENAWAQHEWNAFEISFYNLPLHLFLFNSSSRINHSNGFSRQRSLFVHFFIFKSTYFFLSFPLLKQLPSNNRCLVHQLKEKTNSSDKSKWNETNSDVIWFRVTIASTIMTWTNWKQNLIETILKSELNEKHISKGNEKSRKKKTNCLWINVWLNSHY